MHATLAEPTVAPAAGLVLGPPSIRHKPSRAETARTNGALSRGPVSEEGKARSSRNSLQHGLRARSMVPVAALGETEQATSAHLAAVRQELGAVGPVARHLAEGIASAMLRAARAERLEGELLSGLAEAGPSLAKTLHDDRDARASLALLERYRRSAELDLRRGLDTLLRLHKARDDGLLPPEQTAEAAELAFDADLAELPAPSEPKPVKIEPLQRLGVEPPEPPKPPRTPAQLLADYRFYQRYQPKELLKHWQHLTPEQREQIQQAATEEALAKAQGRDPDTLHAAFNARLPA